MHNIDGIKLLKQNSDQAEIWNIHYKFSPPISNRTFTVLQVIGPSSTPTMGGFNFPQNVNFNRGNGHTAQGQGSSRVGGSNLGSNSSGVGLKRTFDSAQ